MTVICEECSRAFKTPKGLQIHSRVHKKDEVIEEVKKEPTLQYECNRCYKKTNEIYSQNDRLLCNYCNEVVKKRG